MRSFLIRRGIQSVEPFKALYTSSLTDLFIPTPYRLLWESFIHDTITAQILFTCMFSALLIARYSPPGVCKTYLTRSFKIIGYEDLTDVNQEKGSESAFNHELCRYSPAMFDSSLLPREEDKPTPYGVFVNQTSQQMPLI